MAPEKVLFIFAKTDYSMIFIENEGNTNPRLNLALEEYALRNFSADNDYLLFYINEPSIIIGRNQNTLEEINHEYIEQNNIDGDIVKSQKASVRVVPEAINLLI